MMTKPHEDRLRRNDESRYRADNHAEQWTKEEDEFLQAFWKDADEAEVAEILGRTIEACRQRFYIVRRGEVKSTVVERSDDSMEVGTRYIGLLDDPDDQWWSPDYYTKGK